MSIDTGDCELVEGNNWHDLFWGADGKTSEGENHQNTARIPLALAMGRKRALDFTFSRS